MGDKVNDAARRWNTDSERVYDDTRSLVAWARFWSLSPASWDYVTELLRRVQTGFATADLTAVVTAHQELARVALSEARRFGAEPDPGKRPPPATRKLLNVLVHDLGAPSAEPAEVDQGQNVASDDARDAGGGGPLLAELGTFARRVFSLPVLDRNRVAFAASEDHDGLLDEVTVAGVRVVRRNIGHNAVSLMIISGDLARVGDILGVSVQEETSSLSYLLPVWADLTGELVAGIELHTLAVHLGVDITLPFPASLLDETDAAAIRRSIAGATRSGRNAWRSIARTRSEEDPVRSAVVEGLR